MSHELRTPLNAIAGYAELLEMGIHGAVTEAQREALRRIQTSQRHLLSLIEDILNFARIEAGRLALHIAHVSVDRLFTEIEPLVAPQLRAKSLTYDVAATDPALAVHADGEKIRQILINLLSNAIKFTAPGGTISVAAEPSDDRVAIAVRDTGVGIPHDKQTAIFDPFVQLGRTLANTPEGAGLGLAISRDLARAMGGELTVESEVGVGSTFTLSMPRVES
jgi:signal transduction histidine kinase